jgi:hypothetical protein
MIMNQGCFNCLFVYLLSLNKNDIVLIDTYKKINKQINKQTLQLFIKAAVALFNIVNNHRNYQFNYSFQKHNKNHSPSFDACIIF